MSSAVGVGTTFTVYLPACTESGGQSALGSSHADRGRLVAMR